MRKAGWSVILAVALLSLAAEAQERGKDKEAESATVPTANQSAPRNSPEASGHDVQTGMPKTGERPANENQEKDESEKDESEEKSDDVKQSK